MYYKRHYITLNSTTTTTTNTTTTEPPLTRPPQPNILDVNMITFFSKMPFQNILDDHGANLVVDAIALAPPYYRR